MTAAETGEIMTYLQLMYPNFYGKQTPLEQVCTLATWANSLKDIDPYHARDAAVALTQTLKFAPTLAELLEAVDAERKREDSHIDGVWTMYRSNITLQRIREESCAGVLEAACAEGILQAVADDIGIETIRAEGISSEIVRAEVRRALRRERKAHNDPDPIWKNIRRLIEEKRNDTQGQFSGRQAGDRGNLGRQRLPGARNEGAPAGDQVHERYLPGN